MTQRYDIVTAHHLTRKPRDLLPPGIPKCRRSGMSLRILVPPELGEPIRRKRSVPCGALQISMPEIVRQRACVVPIVRKLVTGRVAQHVRMDLEQEPRSDAGSLDHAQEPRWRDRRSCFRDEHVGARSLQWSQGPKLWAM